MPLCFQTITTFERYPEWFSGIQHAAILSHDEHGLGKQVEFAIDMMLKRVRYVLEYEYERPHRLTWRSIDGDIESIKGSYDFEKVAASRTRVTCRQAISVGFWVPGPIRKMLEQSALRQSVLDFKTAAETAAVAGKRGAKKA